MEWTQRDNLPKEDIHDDICRTQVMSKLEKDIVTRRTQCFPSYYLNDVDAYEQTMKGRLVNPRNKVREGFMLVTERDCDCGAKHTSNKNIHASWCRSIDVRRV